MSGPKITIYLLTPEQRAAIIENILRQQEILIKHEELLTKAAEMKQRITAAVKQAENCRFIADESSRHLEDGSLIEKLNQIDSASKDLLGSLDTIKNSLTNDKIESVLNDVRLKFQSTAKAVEQLTNTSVSIEEDLSVALNKQASGLFSCTESASDADTVSREHAKTVLSLLSEYTAVDYLPSSLKRQAAALVTRFNTADNTCSLDNMIAIEALPLIKKCNTFTTLWEDIGSEYQKLYCRYEVLLEETHSQQDAELIAFSPDAIPKLKTAIALLEEQQQKAAEQAYIAETLADVMTDMGYSMWGHRDVTKRSGTHFHSELFKYDTDTAVNVTYATDGQITMELGKVDKADRLPSHDEEGQLEQKMVTFCHDFSEIESELKKRGICIGNRIALSPPSAAYAQIINIDDYSNTDTASTTQATNQHKEQLTQKVVED